MGIAHQAYETANSDAAKIIETTKDIRQRCFEKPFAQMQNGLTEFVKLREADATRENPLLDADDIAIQNAELQTLIDNMKNLIAQAEALMVGQL